MPPFHRVDDWGAFWRNDVIGWEGYWVFIFLTEMYIALAVIVWIINWLRVRERDYWKEWLAIAIAVVLLLRFLPWNLEPYGVANSGGDNMNNMLVNECCAKIDRKYGFTWSDAKTKTNDDRLTWASIRMSWKRADTKLEAVSWKIAWFFIYACTMSLTTLAILCSFGMTKEKK